MKLIYVLSLCITFRQISGTWGLHMRRVKRAAAAAERLHANEMRATATRKAPLARDSTLTQGQKAFKSTLVDPNAELINSYGADLPDVTCFDCKGDRCMEGVDKPKMCSGGVCKKAIVRSPTSLVLEAMVLYSCGPASLGSGCSQQRVFGYDVETCTCRSGRGCTSAFDRSQGKVKAKRPNYFMCKQQGTPCHALAECVPDGIEYKCECDAGLVGDGFRSCKPPPPTEQELAEAKAKRTALERQRRTDLNAFIAKMKSEGKDWHKHHREMQDAIEHRIRATTAKRPKFTTSRPNDAKPTPAPVAPAEAQKPTDKKPKTTTDKPADNKPKEPRRTTIAPKKRNGMADEPRRSVGGSGSGQGPLDAARHAESAHSVLSDAMTAAQERTRVAIAQDAPAAPTEQSWWDWGKDQLKGAEESISNIVSGAETRKSGKDKVSCYHWEGLVRDRSERLGSAVFQRHNCGTCKRVTWPQNKTNAGLMDTESYHLKYVCMGNSKAKEHSCEARTQWQWRVRCYCRDEDYCTDNDYNDFAAMTLFGLHDVTTPDSVQ